MKLTDQQIRIKLAEAMGWHKATSLDIWCRPEDVDRKGKNYNNGELPDPLNDANDDYAVLEWMRDQPPIMKDGYLHLPYCDAMDDALAYEYEVGNNARAALKVMT